MQKCPAFFYGGRGWGCTGLLVVVVAAAAVLCFLVGDAQSRFFCLGAGGGGGCTSGFFLLGGCTSLAFVFVALFSWEGVVRVASRDQPGETQVRDLHGLNRSSQTTNNPFLT